MITLSIYGDFIGLGRVNSVHCYHLVIIESAAPMLFFAAAQRLWISYLCS
jgi:hypothetical protein